MKAEWNTSRHLGDPDWSGFDIRSAEDSKIAAIFIAAIDHRNYPTIAFRCGRRTRNKDRLSRRIACGELIDRPLSGLEVNMGDTIEVDVFPPCGTVSEPLSRSTMESSSMLRVSRSIVFARSSNMVAFASRRMQRWIRPAFGRDRHRIWRCGRARPCGNGLAGHARFSGAPSSRLCSRRSSLRNFRRW